MDLLLNPISFFDLNGAPLEIVASVLVIWCVILAAQNKTLSYPVGIVGTLLFFFVFWFADLYASAVLQLYFVPVQMYGWWYWTRGCKRPDGRRTAPAITDWPWRWIGYLTLGGVATTMLIARLLKFWMPTQAMPHADVAILAFSVVAQFLLDRRIMKNWILWLGVNVISIPLYASQGLYLAAITYVVLFLNVFYGWSTWRKIRIAQGSESAEAAAFAAVAAKNETAAPTR
jgi:nicotinamide mononucleotide transporter